MRGPPDYGCTGVAHARSHCTALHSTTTQRALLSPSLRSIPLQWSEAVVLGQERSSRGFLEAFRNSGKEGLAGHKPPHVPSMKQRHLVEGCC